MLLFEYVEGVFAFRIGGIVQAISFYSISGVDDKQILPICFGSFSHASRKGDVVTPVSGERWSIGVLVLGLGQKDTLCLLLKVASMPSMSISGM